MDEKTERPGAALLKSLLQAERGEGRVTIPDRILARQAQPVSVEPPMHGAQVRVPEVLSVDDEASLRTALKRLSVLIDLDPEADTPEGVELETLGALVEAYESMNYPIGMPTPAEAIEFRLEQQALSPADLVPLIGSRELVDEVLAGRAPVTLAMAQRLHDALGISIDTLMQIEQPAGTVSFSLLLHSPRSPISGLYVGVGRPSAGEDVQVELSTRSRPSYQKSSHSDWYPVASRPRRRPGSGTRLTSAKGQLFGPFRTWGKYRLINVNF